MNKYVDRTISGIKLKIDIKEPNRLFIDEKYIDEIENFDIETMKKFFYKKNKGYIPFLANWELTSVCNYSCPFCYINQKDVPKKTYTFDEAKDIIDILVEKGLLFVNLTGGEVFTNGEFIRIYKYLKSKGVIVSIFTNLSLLNDNILNTLIEYKPYVVEVSLYGYSNERFSRTIGCTDSIRNRVYENLNKLIINGINVKCKTPVTKLTEPEIEDIYDYCNTIGVDYYVSSSILDGYNGASNKEYLIENLNYSSTDSKSFSDICSKRKMAFDCSAGETNLYISFNKRIYPCMNAYGENELSVPIFDNDNKVIPSFVDDFEDIIKRYKNKPLCKGCKEHKNCSYCIVEHIKKEKMPCKKTV